MRSCFLALATVVMFAICPSLWAQVAGSSPGKPGQTNSGQPTRTTTTFQQQVMEGILAAWEADAKALQSLFVEFRIEEKGDPFSPNKITASHGEAKVLKMPTGQYSVKLEIFNLDRN